MSGSVNEGRVTRFTTLGRTGLRVSVAGLGCGGHSRLGQTSGATESDSVAVVERVLDLGVNFIDTARAYRTEPIVGKAIAGKRHSVVISTKVIPRDSQGLLGADRLIASLEHSLKRLRTDYVDVFHLHGVDPDQYEHCVQELVPALHRLREQGKIRFLGITERFSRDPQHRMLKRALRDDCWDVLMVGFNLLNPSARERVLQPAIERGVGTLIMFAVRRALSQPAELRKVVLDLVERGAIPSDGIDLDDPLGFLIAQDCASGVVEAAYRFCSHEPGAHVILSGTGKIAHLEQNVAAIESGPLPTGDLERLRGLFGTVDFISGN